MDKPIPHVDPAPPEGPGGVDAVHEEVPLPPVIPDPPMSAQLDDAVVPETVAEPDDKQQEGRTSDATANPPSSDDPE
ncbi:MAG: hypothetical protein ACTHNS_04075 [Marmoricola sp.]